jgi:N-acyl homoserine lactone hydrolase
MVILDTALRMWALDGPTGSADRSMLEQGASGQFSIRIPTFLIEHRDGVVLFDTGLDPRAATDAAEIYGAVAELMHIEFNREQRLDIQMKALGYEMEDIDHVVVSHLHLDHAGGMSLFPHAQFWLGSGEQSHAIAPIEEQAGFFHDEDLESLRRFRYEEVVEDRDLFGDGSISLLSTPGHTPGHLSLVVRLPGRNFVLSGDATHTRNSLAELIPLPSEYDSEAAVRSMQRLVSIEASADATIWISHDTEDWATFGAPRCFE